MVTTDYTDFVYTNMNELIWEALEMLSIKHGLTMQQAWEVYERSGARL